MQHCTPVPVRDQGTKVGRFTDEPQRVVHFKLESLPRHVSSGMVYYNACPIGYGGVAVRQHCGAGSRPKEAFDRLARTMLAIRRQSLARPMANRSVSPE